MHMSRMPIILGVVIARLLFDCSLTLGAAAPVYRRSAKIGRVPLKPLRSCSPRGSR